MKTNSSKSPNQLAHPAFTYLRKVQIPTLNLEIQEFRHKVTGAAHFHLASDNKENVFLVALRTIPSDSTGVAHVLEHTVLCGSENYPVRDPFFMMIRRSLNTFMNAFTSSDWTAYPFASQNKKDFNNLLSVYLDAVFFSRLNELDFKQEGHRLEFEEIGNPNSPLLYKGVVYNEMKGAMGSEVSVLWQVLTKYMFPNITYHYNSGGEPDVIPDLSYTELVDFYRTHYHPSNAVFMTYGDISAAEQQEKFETLALSRFQVAETTLSVPNEKRYLSPINVEEYYPVDGEENRNKKTHHVMAWLLGESNQVEAQFCAHLLAGVLLDNSASPLLHALETTELGTSPSPLCGLEDSNKEMILMCGLEGSEPQHAEAFEQLVLGVLREVAETGVEQGKVEAVLHQFELEQREIGGGSYPYGLQLILEALPAAIHRGDPVKMLDIDEVLADLREKIKDPQFVKSLVRDLLLNNQHRVRLSLKPDPGLQKRQQDAERKTLDAIRAKLTRENCEQLIEQAKSLQLRQQSIDDMEILPKVGRSDIPTEMYIASGEARNLGGFKATAYKQATNGIAYLQAIVPLPQFDQGHMAAFPYFTSCLTELGFAEHDYLTAQSLQASVTGGIHAYSSMRGEIDDIQKASGYFFLAGKSLNRNTEKLVELCHDIFQRARFDETERVKELIAQQRANREQSVLRNGHSLVMQAASCGMSAVANLKHRLNGLEGIRYIKALDKNLIAEKQAIEVLCDQFAEIHRQILNQPLQFVLVNEDSHIKPFSDALQSVWSPGAATPASQFALEPIRQQVRQVWTTNTPVNFCAKAYPVVGMQHPDAPALSVLGGFLKNGYLHTAIREKGGAYGSGAGYQSEIGAFRFHSYRDPRLMETLDDFDHALDWLASDSHEDRLLEEAIIGVIGGIDKPTSPSSEAKDAFQNELFGRTPKIRQAFRASILNVSLRDLQRVGETYFARDVASIAVITNAESAKTLTHLNLEAFTL